MIQHVSIDAHTHDMIAQAARNEGMAYDAKLALIVSDWARAQKRQQTTWDTARHTSEFGVIPGGD
jgi:hypothetical protein